jgi:excisionase family DNA binding protein
MAERVEPPKAQPQPQRKYGTVADACAMSGLSEVTVRRMLRGGELKTYKVRRRTLIDLAELDALIQASAK